MGEVEDRQQNLPLVTSLIRPPVRRSEGVLWGQMFNLQPVVFREERRVVGGEGCLNLQPIVLGESGGGDV